MKQYTQTELRNIYANYLSEKGFSSDLDILSIEEIESFVTQNLTEEDIKKYNK